MKYYIAFLKKYQVKNYLKKFYYTIFKKHPLFYLGKIISYLYKSRYNQIIPEHFHEKSNNIIDAAIKIAFLDKFYSWDDSKRRNFLKKYLWGAEQGKEYIQGDNDISNTLKAQQYNNIFTWIKPIISDYNLNKIIEIGTGEGIFLSIIKNNFRDRKDINYTGVDLNNKLIAIAQKKNKNDSNINFTVADGNEFLQKKNYNNSLFIYVATLQYFTPLEIKEHFNLISKFKDSYILLYEPINIDLKNQLSSKPRGRGAYSHNYIKLAEKYKLEIIKSKITPLSKEDYLYQSITLMLKSTFD